MNLTVLRSFYLLDGLGYGTVSWQGRSFVYCYGLLASHASMLSIKQILVCGKNEFRKLYNQYSLSYQTLNGHIGKRDQSMNERK